MTYDSSPASDQDDHAPLAPLIDGPSLVVRQLDEEPAQFRRRREAYVAAQEVLVAATAAPVCVESEQIVGPRHDAIVVGSLEPLEDCAGFDGRNYRPRCFGNGIPDGLHVIDEVGGTPSNGLPVSQVLPSGQLVALVGPIKVGKTLTAIEIGARLSRGEPVLDLVAGRPRRTLLVAASEGGETATHWPRLHAANVDPTLVTVVTHQRFYIPGVVDTVSLLSLPDDLTRLETAIRRMKPTLVVVNTLRALAVDPSQKTLGAILDRLSEIAQQLDVTIVLVDYNDGSWRSHLIQQRVRVVLELAIGPDGSTRRLRAKCAAGSPIGGHNWQFQIDGVNGVPKITWLGPGEASGAHARRGPKPRQDLAVWLRARLVGGVLREVVMTEADLHGYPQSSVDRAFRRMKGRSEPLGDGTGRYVWRPA